MADETDLEISITTTADTSGAEEARAAVEGVGEAAEGAGQQIDGADKSWEQMNADNAQFAASDPAIGLREVGAAASESAPALRETAEGAAEVSGGLREILGHIPGFNTFSEILSRLGTGTMGAIAAGVTAIGSALALAGKSLADFSEKEKQVSELDQILANTGQLTGEFRLKLQELADQFEETTGIGDERFLKVMSTLVKFGATSENIDELTHAVVNMSGAIGVDVERAATLMGKAMHGNVTMLQRYGIHVTKGASDTEKLNQVMEQLATRGGGVLEGRTQTLGGQFTRLHIAVGNFLEGLGNLISRTGLVQDVIGGLSTSINFLANLFPKAVEQTSILKSNLDPLRKSMGEAAEGADELGDATNKAASAAGKHKTALEQATQAIKDNANASKESADASLKLAEAEIKLQVAQGKFSKEEGALRIAQLREELELKKLLIDRDALMAQKTEISKTEEKTKDELFERRKTERAAQSEFEKFSPRRTPEDYLGQVARARTDVQRLESRKDIGLESLGSGVTPQTDEEIKADLEGARKKLAGLEAGLPAAQAAIRAKAAVDATTEAIAGQVKELEPKIKAINAELSVAETQIKAAQISSRASTIERAQERRKDAGLAPLTPAQLSEQASGGPVITTGGRGVGGTQTAQPRIGELESGIRDAGATDPLARSVDKLINVTKEVAGANVKRSMELERKIQELQNQMRNNDRTQKLPGG